MPHYFGSRNFATCIYYLLNGNEFSAFHKLKSDELWHFYDGCSLDIFIILPDGNMIKKTLGKDIEEGESMQQVIPADHWFAARPSDKKSYCLSGCTMAPGFDIKDFELASYDELLKQFPQYSEKIRLLINT